PTDTSCPGRCGGRSRAVRMQELRRPSSCGSLRPPASAPWPGGPSTPSLADGTATSLTATDTSETCGPSRSSSAACICGSTTARARLDVRSMLIQQLFDPMQPSTDQVDAVAGFAFAVWRALDYHLLVPAEVESLMEAGEKPDQKTMFVVAPGGAAGSDTTQAH